MATMKSNQILSFKRYQLKTRIKKAFAKLSDAMQKTNESFSVLSNVLTEMKIEDD
jgi:hypothetical protein